MYSLRSLEQKQIKLLFQKRKCLECGQKPATTTGLCKDCNKQYF